MSEMLVRVATAIRDKYRQAVVEDRLMDSMELARAAITAMREPTEEMSDAGAWFDADDRGNQGSLSVATGVWKVMIDAALKEE